ncbi:MAG: DUF4468 domain-containing protein [Bacteroidales bacterium]|nr:DUF4468 domain-containing protein [Bacteroidales bacterium]
MKRLVIITLLILCTSLAAFGQWGDDAWKVEKTVEMPGVSRSELYKRAFEVLWNYPTKESQVTRCYDYVYSQSLMYADYDLRIPSLEANKTYRVDLRYDLAIYCYDNYYVVKITGIMPGRVHGPNFMKVPLDNVGLSSKDAAFLDTLRAYLTDELEWHLPSVKRGMSVHM